MGALEGKTKRKIKSTDGCMLFYIVAITELKRFNVQQGFSEDWLNDVTEAVLK